MTCPHPSCSKEFEPVVSNPTMCPYCMRLLSNKAVKAAQTMEGVRRTPVSPNPLFASYITKSGIIHHRSKEP